jgi:prepilin-type N-terminal cleavage/methylation domain-containing protein
MTQEKMRRIIKSKKGFTLIELLVVVLIIGILAAIAVPQYFKVVEKGKVAEALQWVGTVQGAQESYLAQYGVYASVATDLAVGVSTILNNFATPTLAYISGASPSWTAVLVRNSPYPAGYSSYTITYTSNLQPSFSCGANTACQTDLLPN